MGQRDVARNEHVMDIRAGIPVLKNMYGMHIDENDYLDIAVDTLRNVKHFGTTEYIMYAAVNKTGKVLLPCNINTIDAVTDEHMGRKVFNDREECNMDGVENTDTYYKMERIKNELVGKEWKPGLGGFRGEGYISYTLDGRYITVSNQWENKKVAVAFTGISSDLEGFPLITRKQANAIASVCARVLCVRGANRGDKALASMIEYYTGNSGRLVQAASIPEDITDNELDELLDAKVTFNKKSYRRPTKYSR